MRKTMFRYDDMNGVIILPFILLFILVSSCGDKQSYSIYQFDNGDDYFCEGLQRIVNKDGKIGFADSLGNVAIEPRFAFAFPFEDGYAKVTDEGKSEPVGEHRTWVSDSWYYIDHGGNTHPEIFDLKGIVFDSTDGTPLNQAFVKDLTNHRATISKDDGSFSIRVNDGDSINIGFVGFYPQTIKVASSDSVYWHIAMKETAPIIEPMLQKSYSTTPGVSMTVLNADGATLPIDSLNVVWRNNTNSTVFFGEWFEIQDKENGQWKELPIDEKYMDNGRCEIVFNMVAYILKEASSCNDIVKPWFYGKNLNRGVYRLVKTFHFDNKERQDTAFVEFEIR